MPCLPVKRNVELNYANYDSSKSLVYEQAYNRTIAAQVVLKNILESDKELSLANAKELLNEFSS